MKSEELISIFAKYGVSFVTGVPDSLQKDFCFAVADANSGMVHISATNEGTAIGLAIGHQLASGHTPLIYMQNSGLGNAFNPLISLAHSSVYKIPMILMIGWRGEPGTSDEPQHMTQGQISQDLLNLLRIPHVVVDSHTQMVEVEDFLTKHLGIHYGPIALLVSANSFEKYQALEPEINEHLMSRERAVQLVTKCSPIDAVFVSTTGKVSRELNEVREENQEVGRDFMTVGGMGHASAIALGVTQGASKTTVICIDGDGAALMHLGVMAMVGELKPKNFIHVIMNNGTHESVGGQPIAANVASFQKLSESLGYESGIVLETESEVIDYFENIRNILKPCLVELHSPHP